MGQQVRSATTELWKYARNQNTEQKQMHKDMRHRILAWKTQMWEKPRQRTGCRKYHYTRGIHCRGNSEATTSRPLPRHTRRRLHRGGNDLSLAPFRRQQAVTTEATTSFSLSHSLCIQLHSIHIQQPYQHYESMCPKSYLYIYDFSAYLHLCSSDRFGTDRGRFCDEPVLCIFHPVPSGGTCFPTEL